MSVQQQLIGIKLKDGTEIKEARLLENHNAYVLNEKKLLSLGAACKVVDDPTIVDFNLLIDYNPNDID